MSGAEIDVRIRQWHAENVTRTLRECGMDPYFVEDGLQAIRDLHAHELAEKIRNFRCLGCECVPDQCRISHATQAFDADLIDPEVSR